MFNPPQTVGIDISDFKLRIVALRKNYRKLELSSFGEVDLPAGIITNGIIKQPDALVVALKTLAKNLKSGWLKNKQVNVGLPEQQSFIATLAVGELSKDEITKEAIKNLPFSKEDMYFDVEINRIHKTSTIAAGRKEYIDTFISTIERASFQIAGLQIEADAISKALFSNPETHSGCIVLDLGSARTTVIFYIHSSVYFTTSYPSVLNGNSIDQNNLQAVVQQIIGFYQEHFEQKSKLINILLCGSGAYVENISPYITQLTGIETALGNPFSSLRENHLSKKMARPLTYATAIGLALYK